MAYYDAVSVLLYLNALTFLMCCLYQDLMLIWQLKSAKTSKKEYEIYTSCNPSHSSRKKVYITKQRKSCHLCYCQAREWVTLWHRDMGHRATPQAMIDALQKMLHTEDLVEQIRMEIPK